MYLENDVIVHVSIHRTIGHVYLVYWKEEDSVSVTHRGDMAKQVSEPAVGDAVKITFQHQVCEGVLAEVGTPRTMRSKEEAFLRGEYTPFSGKRPAPPVSPPSDQGGEHQYQKVPRRKKLIRRILHLKEVDEDVDEGGETRAEAEEPAGMVEDVVEDVVGRVVAEVDEAHDPMVCICTCMIVSCCILRTCITMLCMF